MSLLPSEAYWKHMVATMPIEDKARMEGWPSIAAILIGRLEEARAEIAELKQRIEDDRLEGLEEYDT